MTEQQKPKVTRLAAGSAGNVRYWSLDYGDQGHTVAVDAGASANELRAIADEMEKDELDKLRGVWQQQAGEAFSKTVYPPASAAVTAWFVSGFVAAKEADYRDH